MDIKGVLDQLKAELDGAGTTYLSTATVYKCDKMSWDDVRAVFLIWEGHAEEGTAIGDGDSFTDIHRITVDVRQEFTDATGATRDPEDWYDTFLDFYEEVKQELTAKATRRLTVSGDTANKSLISDVSVGYIGENQASYYLASIALEVYVPQG